MGAIGGPDGGPAGGVGSFAGNWPDGVERCPAEDRLPGHPVRRDDRMDPGTDGPLYAALMAPPVRPVAAYLRDKRHGRTGGEHLGWRRIQGANLLEVLRPLRLRPGPAGDLCCSSVAALISVNLVKICLLWCNNRLRR